jgi:hypothetical protein
MQLNIELLILMRIRQPSRSSAQLLLTVLNQTAQQIISTAVTNCSESDSPADHQHSFCGEDEYSDWTVYATVVKQEWLISVGYCVLLWDFHCLEVLGYRYWVSSILLNSSKTTSDMA